MPPYFVFIANTAYPETAIECRFLGLFAARAFGVKTILTVGEQFTADLAKLEADAALFIYSPLLPKEIDLEISLPQSNLWLCGVEQIEVETLSFGASFLTVSFPDLATWAESSRPKVSALGALLFQAFSGEQSALIDDQLSLKSLQLFFEKNLPPEVQIQGGDSKQVILSDFSAAPLASLNLHSLTLKMFESLRVKEVLTQIKHWGNYSKEQISYAVNRDLPTYYLPNLEKLAAGLLNHHSFATFEVDVHAEESEICFPNGFFTVSYEPYDKKMGQLVLVLELEKIWLQDAHALIKLLETFRFAPISIALTPEKSIGLEGIVERGKARGFTLVALGENKITLEKNELEVTFEENSLLLESNQLSSLLTAEQKLMPILADLLPWD